MYRINGFISAVTGILVLFLTGAAFVLSFHALADLALSAGVTGSLAWLYPAIIDGAIIVFSLSVLRANLNGDRAAYPWMLVGMFTVLSVILNIVHAQASLLARFLAAIPPAALFLSFELFMTQVKALAKRMNAFKTLKVVQMAIQKERAELNAIVQDQQQVLGKLDREIQTLERKRQILVDEVEQMQNEKTAQSASNTAQLETARQARASNKQEAMEELVEYLNVYPNATLSEMAEAIGRSKSTASNYVRELQGTGELSKNGSGWTVKRD